MVLSTDLPDFIALLDEPAPESELQSELALLRTRTHHCEHWHIYRRERVEILNRLCDFFSINVGIDKVQTLFACQLI